jgi:hypothetical protein
MPRSAYMPNENSANDVSLFIQIAGKEQIRQLAGS